MVSQSYLNSSSSTIPKEMQTVQKIVLNGLHSPHSKRVYRMAIQNFLAYWVEQGMPVPDKLFLQTYIFEKSDQGLSSSSLNLRLSAIKNFAREAVDLRFPIRSSTSYIASIAPKLSKVSSISAARSNLER